MNPFPPDPDLFRRLSARQPERLTCRQFALCVLIGAAALPVAVALLAAAMIL